MPLTLYGFRPSVYCWIVRLALRLRGAEATWIEVDPFDDPGPDYRTLHPFGRVPTLDHDGFVLYETAAIVRYLDAVLPGPRFATPTPRQAARQAQIVGVLDAYGYHPLVRAVFGHGVYRPRLGEPADPARRQEGLDAAGPVLGCARRRRPAARGPRGTPPLSDAALFPDGPGRTGPPRTPRTAGRLARPVGGAARSGYDDARTADRSEVTMTAPGGYSTVSASRAVPEAAVGSAAVRIGAKAPCTDCGKNKATFLSPSLFNSLAPFARVQRLSVAQPRGGRRARA